MDMPVLIGTSHRKHIQSVLCKLHWLPVDFWIGFKVLINLQSLEQMYLHDHFFWYTGRALWSSIQNLSLEGWAE